MQTGQWYKDQVLRRIRVTPDSRFDVYDVINRAGTELLNSRAWDLCLRDREDVAAVAGQDFIPCPRGWTKVLQVVSATAGRYIDVVTLDRFEEVRTRVLVEPTQPWRWRVALDSVPAETPDTSPRLGYRIWPTPTAAGQPTLRMRGIATWVDFNAQNLSLRPSLPKQWHPALYLAICATAAETLQPAMGPAPERRLLEDAIEKLWETEQEAETDAGELRGGVDDMTDPIDARVVDWTTFPGT